MRSSPVNTRVGLATFTTSTSEVLSLGDEIDPDTAVSNHTSSLARDGSRSMNVKTSVSWAMADFETYDFFFVSMQIRYDNELIEMR